MGSGAAGIGYPHSAINRRRRVRPVEDDPDEVVRIRRGHCLRLADEFLASPSGPLRAEDHVPAVEDDYLAAFSERIEVAGGDEREVEMGLERH